MAGSLVSFVEPLAAGSGIAEIKTYLNGIHIKGLLTVRTYFSLFEALKAETRGSKFMIRGCGRLKDSEVKTWHTCRSGHWLQSCLGWSSPSLRGWWLGKRGHSCMAVALSAEVWEPWDLSEHYCLKKSATEYQLCQPVAHSAAFPALLVCTDNHKGREESVQNCALS